ncbi:hypothetical protein FO519_005473 [Halicephalobus sp. NKZ332]|nr:hypothetical protein FO519_005473 [Halicephalobus sp. NKZ332]
MDEITNTSSRVNMTLNDVDNVEQLELSVHSYDLYRILGIIVFIIIWTLILVLVPGTIVVHNIDNNYEGLVENVLKSNLSGASLLYDTCEMMEKRKSGSVMTFLDKVADSISKAQDKKNTIDTISNILPDGLRDAIHSIQDIGSNVTKSYNNFKSLEASVCSIVHYSAVDLSKVIHDFMVNNIILIVSIAFLETFVFILLILVSWTWYILDQRALLGLLLFAAIMVVWICQCCRCKRSRRSKHGSKYLAIILIALGTICLGALIGCFVGSGKMNGSVSTAVDGLDSIKNSIQQMLDSCIPPNPFGGNSAQHLNDRANLLNQGAKRTQDMSKKIHKVSTEVISPNERLRNINNDMETPNIDTGDIDDIEDARKYVNRVKSAAVLGLIAFIISWTVFTVGFPLAVGHADLCAYQDNFVKQLLNNDLYDIYNSCESCCICCDTPDIPTGIRSAEMSQTSPNIRFGPSQILILSNSLSKNHPRTKINSENADNNITEFYKTKSTASSECCSVRDDIDKTRNAICKDAINGSGTIVICTFILGIVLFVLLIVNSLTWSMFHGGFFLSNTPKYGGFGKEHHSFTSHESSVFAPQESSFFTPRDNPGFVAQEESFAVPQDSINLTRPYETHTSSHNTRPSKRLAIALLTLNAVCLFLLTGCLAGNARIKESVTTAVDGIADIYRSLRDALNECASASKSHQEAIQHIDNMINLINRRTKRTKSISKKAHDKVNIQVNSIDRKLQKIKAEANTTDIDPDDVDEIKDARHYVDRVNFFVWLFFFILILIVILILIAGVFAFIFRSRRGSIVFSIFGMIAFAVTWIVIIVAFPLTVSHADLCHSEKDFIDIILTSDFYDTYLSCGSCRLVYECSSNTTVSFPYRMSQPFTGIQDDKAKTMASMNPLSKSYLEVMDITQKVSKNATRFYETETLGSNFCCSMRKGINGIHKGICYDAIIGSSTIISCVFLLGIFMFALLVLVSWTWIIFHGGFFLSISSNYNKYSKGNSSIAPQENHFFIPQETSFFTSQGDTSFVPKNGSFAIPQENITSPVDIHETHISSHNTQPRVPGTKNGSLLVGGPTIVVVIPGPASGVVVVAPGPASGVVVVAPGPASGVVVVTPGASGVVVVTPGASGVVVVTPGATVVVVTPGASGVVVVTPGASGVVIVIPGATVVVVVTPGASGVVVVTPGASEVVVVIPGATVVVVTPGASGVVVVTPGASEVVVVTPGASEVVVVTPGASVVVVVTPGAADEVVVLVPTNGVVVVDGIVDVLVVKGTIVTVIGPEVVVAEKSFNYQNSYSRTKSRYL